jgi:hypothetical protein
MLNAKNCVYRIYRILSALFQGRWQMSQQPRHLDLLVGGRAISMFLFGTEEKAKAIYPLREELGLFYLGGKIAARREKLRRRIEAKEATAQAARREREAENAA